MDDAATPDYCDQNPYATASFARLHRPVVRRGGRV